jgi:hypothetical protein
MEYEINKTILAGERIKIMNGGLSSIRRLLRMGARNKNPCRKHGARPRKNVKKSFSIEIRSALLGGVFTLLAAIISVTAIYHTRKANELREILNDIGEANSLLAEEYQVYLSMREILTGKPVYGPEHIGEFRKTGKYPDRFVEDLRDKTEKIGLAVTKRGFGKKQDTVIRALKALGETDRFFTELFYESGDTLCWKREPAAAEMLIHIYQTQIDALIDRLYRELRLLYGKT